MARFRKKPVEIEAIQWRGPNHEEVKAFLGDDYVVLHGKRHRPGQIQIRTLEGPIWASRGDWIIRGVQGEHYPCKPDIFEVTYEPVARVVNFEDVVYSYTPAEVGEPMAPLLEEIKASGANVYQGGRYIGRMGPATSTGEGEFTAPFEPAADGDKGPLVERLAVIRDRAEFWASRDPEGTQHGLYDRHAVEFARELVEVLEHLDTVTTNRDAFMGINDDLREVIADRKAKQKAAEAAVGRARALADAWDEIPDYQPSDYDRGRVDQRHMAIEELLAAIEGSSNGSEQ